MTATRIPALPGAPLGPVRPSRRLGPRAVGALGLALTSVGFIAAARVERREAELRLEVLAETRCAVLRHEIAAHLDALGGLRAFVAATPWIPPESFRVYAADLRERFPAIRSIHWAQHVSGAERESWERTLASLGTAAVTLRELRDGELRPAGRRAAYLAISYEDPPESGWLGCDLAAHPTLGPALERALEWRVPVVLPGDLHGAHGPGTAGGARFVAALPIRRGPSLAEVPASVDRFLGAGISVLSVDDLVDRALEGFEDEDRGVSVILAEVDEAGTSTVLARRGSDAGGLLRHEVELEAGDRRWRLACLVDARAFGWPPWLVLGAGLLLTGVLVAHLAQRARAEAALEESEERYRVLVEHAAEAIVLLDVVERRFVDANEKAEELFKLSRAELLRTGPVELSPETQPDGRSTAAFVDDVVASALRGETPVFEWLHRDSAGGEVPCEVRLVRLTVGGRALVRGSLTDISERKRAEARQVLMMRELDHRVKNNLATVQALADHTRATAASAADFHEAFTGRIRALARTHEALADARWEGVELTDLVRLSLGAFDAEGRVSWTGEPVLLPEHASLPMGMTLHELATNAAKHGALSADGGRVEVLWRVAGGELELVWTEADGPPVAPPARWGLGTQLVRGLVEYELRGRVDLEFAPGGLRCTVRMPVA